MIEMSSTISGIGIHPVEASSLCICQMLEARCD